MGGISSEFPIPSRTWTYAASQTVAKGKLKHPLQTQEWTDLINTGSARLSSKVENYITGSRITPMPFHISGWVFLGGGGSAGGDYFRQGEFCSPSCFKTHSVAQAMNSRRPFSFQLLQASATTPDCYPLFSYSAIKVQSISHLLPYTVRQNAALAS